MKVIKEVLGERLEKEVSFVGGTVRRISLAIGFLIGGTATYYGIGPIERVAGMTLSLVQSTSLVIFGACLIGLIFFLLGPAFANWVWQLVTWVEARLYRASTQDVISGAIGLILGLIIANLLGSALSRIPLLGPYLPTGSMLLLGYLGVVVATKKKDDLFGIFNISGRTLRERPDHSKSAAAPKILDTSVIIDGRIADICRTGFIEGPLVIPAFVLDELRHVADSSDILKRNRGRRGLDVLNRIQKELSLEVQVYEKELGNLEVDSKLIKLARVLSGRIVTNDYNLNKVCELQRIPVLNINDLANAVKPVVLPGEEMMVHLLKEGKESGQGVGYLDDGTMIVVDGGRKHIGETLGVLVTSVLQTAAGRMIFAKPKNYMEKAGA
jgi:uncharacterized protein YacL